MKYTYSSSATAILLMAVLFLGLMISGCATGRQIEVLRAEIDTVKTQNQQTNSKLDHLDTVITQEAESNRKLRADISVTIDQLEEQISALQESYNDLLQKIDAIYKATTERRRIISSPGAQQTQPETAPPPQEAAASADCSAKYDNAFILVMRGDYKKAIDDFNVFLKDCENHELAQNAHYWIGESYYSLEQYENAIQEFEYLLEHYKNSVNASRALYKLGRSKQELGKIDEAKKIFKQLIDDHPGTLEAEQARERLKDLK